MHELSLTRNIVSIVNEHANGKAVKRIQLSIGPQACVEQKSVEFCFDIVAKGTQLENANLEFVVGEADAFLIKEYELLEAI